ncbi:hypothetical protein GPJ56_002463 [Histomonas meleagridis]|uniref:uncharacterized protein n=1 Tax=Histomonas meleagridis TaxID=135588 RepID=UPI003559D8DA|nr:hypothetical protein GPJ56_002463 [Histomonas meleagridis]KAH0798252.1 hypothetical protein GO595_008940 [Histomonas meleagridis]
MLWTIDANIPNCSMKTLTKEDIETMNLSTIKLSTTEIPKVLYPLLLQKIINPDPNFDSDYAQLKKQWESTTEGQWRHHFKLREFVACIEKWIQKPHLKTEYHKKLFFNLSMTMFTHYFGEFPPTSQFISMVKTIFQAFLTDDADENGFKFVDGSKLTFDQTEVFLFKYVRDAWTIISKDKYDPKKDFMCVRATLLNLSPSTFEVINDHGVDSFDFFKADCDSFYAKCRTQEDRLLMFVAMLLSGNLTQFKQTIIAIASVLGHEQLHLIPVNDTQCFCQMFCNIFRHIDTRLLLHNYEKIQMSL